MASQFTGYVKGKLTEIRVARKGKMLGYRILDCATRTVSDRVFRDHKGCSAAMKRQLEKHPGRPMP